MYHPDSLYTGPRNPTLIAKTDGELDNRALYLFDTLEFSPQWLLTLGARYEDNVGSSIPYTASKASNNNGASIPLRNDEALFSYRGGLVYKPNDAASWYLSHGNSKTPSKATVNGSCVQIANNALGTNNCNVAPETARSNEVGVKWDFLEGQLSFTGAVFRNERTNYRVADPDPANVSGEQALNDRARVQGALLGLTGCEPVRYRNPTATGRTARCSRTRSIAD